MPFGSGSVGSGAYERLDGGEGDRSNMSAAVGNTATSEHNHNHNHATSQASGSRDNTTGAASPQSQIICTGCRTLLVYPQGAQNVRCALCNIITSVPPAGTDMAQLVCGGCRTLLMYLRGASSVQCSQCNTVNLAMSANQIAHINCGGCGVTLMYAYGAQSVKCAMCNFITQAAAGSFVPNSAGSSSNATNRVGVETVVVENPPSLDENGQTVTNMAVGVKGD
mmetsp:Transcript_5663/g.6503  ORF Transcript_5663/g.6503 Transcript_5663/m.6503 type:complete len:223 (-) Transcript_5663:909-1577(-)|eukprot:CAMPEP_0197847402 /NCGR_PEP_ID=MMETSP1438-20131217/6001_1 /TAXON_ID=1461541 /ORGANISM="Pterosperma sp., Strain CCMP1384" /LENGTH=222 /DNA_ID=CAMNT_0043459313 /DNA_START=178 /DNA_END=846 /DNA_ORIENTATION=+